MDDRYFHCCLITNLKSIKISFLLFFSVTETIIPETRDKATLFGFETETLSSSETTTPFNG